MEERVSFWKYAIYEQDGKKRTSRVRKKSHLQRKKSRWKVL